MRVQGRAWLVSWKICTTLVIVLLAILGSDSAFSQGGTGPEAQAPLFIAIRLTAGGFRDVHASGISGGEQVGYGADQAAGGGDHALLWRGSASSVVDLNPNEFVLSFATATCGGQHVGYGYGSPTGSNDHALLWSRSPGTIVDLHPREFSYSRAMGTSGGQQVGFGVPQGAPQSYNLLRANHALLWHGSAASVVDLNPRGLTSSEARGTDGREQVGYGSGAATGGHNHAMFWRGSAASMVDLHPRGFIDSEALGTLSGQQVGRGLVPGGVYPSGPFHALLWRGTSASVVDLHPRGFIDSEALATNGEEQVGVGNGYALLWRGSPSSVVNLHTFLPSGFVHSYASGIDGAGDIVGTATAPGFNNAHAFLWRRNGLRQGTTRGQSTSQCENSP